MKERGEGAMKTGHLLILTLDELAAYLKIGKRALYRLAAKGEIDQWIADQTQASTNKEVMRKRAQQKSAEQDLSTQRDVRLNRRAS